MVSRTAAVFILTLSGCASPPEGLRLTPDGNGPLIVVDWDAEPLPDIPFPNDLAARPDPTSMTGLRLNLSLQGVTDRESEARGHIDELVGFGIFAPISAAFSEPLDLDEITRRHPNDLERKDRFDDDAFYVIDVEPSSPHYLQPVDLDVGHGRYPVDVEDGSRYFPNDPRASSPSLLFETVNEDLDGDGKLDPGEDTDNDGLLDVANVYPADGDPRTQLMTFYERQSDTLIVRPVVPLREMSRYAVVLTERLVGEDGQPVRSPWKYVNHVRQTDALTPVLDALPEYGLSVDDIAYAWVFTTGRQTGDLVDIHRGLFDGEGPWPFLAATYPASIGEAVQLHTLEGIAPQVLPADILVGGLTGFGAFGDAETEALVEAAYVRFGGSFVGGAFTTPYLLADQDGDGDDSDEVWRIDPVAGTLHAKPLRVSFTCLLPKEDGSAHGPWPVVLYGHGHTSSRLEMLLFAWAMNRMGIAACGFDNPGHGLVFPPELRDLVVGLLSSQGLGPMLTHLEDSRARDLTNDGVVDSGADQWISDPFHSRDMVRQAVVDQMQLVRALRACGQGQMTVRAEDGTAIGTETSCDWDGDGQIDIGGPDAEIYLAGGSLGGITTSVAAAVLPEITASAAIVPGGGLLDVGVRSDLGGVISAVMGRMLTPLVLGLPTETGELQIVQMVNQYLDMQQVSIATIPNTVGGGRIVVENLDNGEVREASIPADGALRIAIPADAPTAVEKRALAGIPADGPGLTTYSVPGNAGLGDRLIISLYDASGTLVTTIDEWQADTLYEGITYTAGSPLVAASHGLGHLRGSTDLRRLVMATALAMEPGDPIAFAPHWFLEPFDALGGKPTNVLVQPGAGDLGVSVSAGIALARAGGILETHAVDARYGTTPERWLIERGVLQGIESAGPYVDLLGYPALFDADNLDEGTDGTGVPSDAPLRATLSTDAGTSGLRISYPLTTGMHGFENPDPTRPFDTAIYVITSAAWYLASGGVEIRDDPCMGADDCADIPPVTDP